MQTQKKTLVLGLVKGEELELKFMDKARTEEELLPPYKRTIKHCSLTTNIIGEILTDQISEQESSPQ